MKPTLVKIPSVVKKSFPNYIWDFSLDEKTIYLTFDDGPTPEITNWTLDILKQYNAKATFFCIGNNIEKHPEIFQNIIKDGHVIGNHSQNHIKGWKSKTDDYIYDVEKAQKVIESQVRKEKSSTVKLFRPPYGQILPKQGKNLIEAGYKVIMWNVLSYDWDKNVSEEKCLKNVIENTNSGSIIVFHDSVKALKNMKYALPKTLEHFSKEGYKFKAIKFKQTLE